MIEYSHSTGYITADQLHGFFVGWPNPPTPETHLRLLRNSDAVVLAVDTATAGGWLHQRSPTVCCAYHPFLRSAAAYQHQHRKNAGAPDVGSLAGFVHDRLLCDADIQPFYEQFEMYPAVGMCARNYARQSGQ